MPEAVVLLSGGLDSATAAAVAHREGFRVRALTIRYGQSHALEVERARALAVSLGVAEHRVIDLDIAWMGGSALTDSALAVPLDRDDEAIADGIPATYVPARNTIFLSLALGWAEVLGATEVYIGANAVDYSGYPDCRPEYFQAFEELASKATRCGVEGRPIRIRAPLLGWSKARIVREAVEMGVDLATTLSCYAPGSGGTPCGRCDSCRLRERGFREAGIPDPSLP